MSMKSIINWLQAVALRIDSFLSSNPLEDPAMLALAFCYNPLDDWSWLGFFSI